MFALLLRAFFFSPRSLFNQFDAPRQYAPSDRARPTLDIARYRQLTIGVNPCIMVPWNVAQFHGSRLAQPDCFSSITPARKPRLVAEAKFHQAQETIFLRRILTALGVTNSRGPEFG
jgi:hypothetical protein